MNVITFGTLTEEKGLTNEESMDLDQIQSNDPLAYAFGFHQGKSGEPMEQSDDLAPEYIRGYKEGQNESTKV